MPLLKSTLLSISCVLGINLITAQSLTESSLALAEATALNPQQENNWTFYLDKSQQILFIDLSKWQGNLTDLKIKTTGGKSIVEEDLTTIPSDAIFELSLKDLEKGTYQLELRTFNGLVSESLQVE